jgi:hypothetical protein
VLGLSTGPGVDYALVLPLCALIAMSFFHGLMQTPVFKGSLLQNINIRQGPPAGRRPDRTVYTDKPTECVQQQQESDLLLSPIQRFISSEDVESRIY